MANLICTYNVKSTTEPTKICHSTDFINNCIEHIIIEGVTHTVSDINSFTGYTFSNLGLNEVVFVLANNVTSIGEDAFEDCIYLTSINIPYGITEIKSGTFSWCYSLTSIIIPDSVTSIGDFAFYYCGFLSSITCNATTVPSILDYTFMHVDEGGTLYYPAGSDYSTWLQGEKYYLGYYGWKGVKFDVDNPPTPEPPVEPDEPDVPPTPDNPEGENLICKYNVTSTTEAIDICYGTDSFSDIIYNGVSIGLVTEYTFPSTGEHTLEFVLKDKTTFSLNAFYHCTGLTSVIIPDSVTTISENAFLGCGLTSVIIPDSVTTISRLAFAYCDNLTSVIIPDSVTTIGDSAFGYCGSLTGELVIPDSVTTIGDAAFIQCSGLTSVIIPNSITTISKHVFDKCKGLTGELVIPDSVTTIGDSAFYYCKGLTGELVIPDSVTTIGDSAFYYCDNLTSLVIGSGVTSIGERAFKDCHGLTGELVIPDSVTTIGEYAFIHCSGLTSLVIGSGVTSIGEYAFAYCDNLTSLVIGSGVTSIGEYAFASCTGLTSVIIPDSVTTIGYCAFFSCTDLTSLVIGSGVTSIGERAFFSCTDLDTIICYTSTAPSINSNTFYGVARGGTLYYPAGSDYSQWLSTEANYLGYYGWNGVEFDVDNPPTPEPPVEPDEPDVPPTPDNPEGENLICTYNVTSTTEAIDICYGTDSFSDIIYNGVSIGLVTEYTFPSTGEHTLEFVLEDKTIIGSYEFYRCSGLTEIIIPDSVTSIGRSVFQSCSNLTSVIIGSGVTSIGINAFQNCYGLTSIDIPDSVTSIEDRAFSDCTNLNNVHIGSGVTSIGTQAFYECTGLTSVIIPDSVTSIGDGAFYKCTGLNNVHIGSGVTSIGIQAFIGCTGLTSVIIPDSVTTIGNSAFMNCSGLTEIIIPDSVTTIGNSAFMNCSGLTEIIIPDSVTSIEQLAFVRCTSLSSLKLGSGVTSIGIDAFGNCTSLIEITIEARTAPTIESKTFYNVATGGTLYYPTGSDYSTWLGNELHYLGYYGWNGVEIDIPDEPDVPPTPPTPPTPDEPEEPVEKTPSVVVSKNNINLDNVGDTSIIQVTYINVDEIVPPEVPDGFTIEEIERVEGENGIQVKYRVTRISPKRQNAQINFKGNTSEGKTATSSNVNLKGEPCPAEVKLWSLEQKDGVLVFEASGTTATVDVIANGANPPYEFSYSIDGNGITCTYNEFDYDNGEGDLSWRYKFTSIPNNGNSPYTGTIIFNYKDELTNKTLSYPFYVKYANEGRIEAGATVYKYDKDGNNLISTNDNRFSISYINMETINEPECDVDWLIVGEGVKDSGVYVDKRIKYNHSITIQPNEGASRRCTVTFSGKGVDGKDYTFDIEVTQEGSDIVKPIDEGFIELQQLSVVLNADGDAQTFQVKYYDAKTIYEPELAGTWATITEVSRTEPVPDTAWNGEECESVIVTYQVTGQHTESGRQMKVKFKSDLNNNNGVVINMEKDKFIIYQLAEGSTEVQGLVSILRYSNTFTYYGSPTGWDFRVAYDDVTPDTPVISEPWCRIAEVKDLNADGYDYYKEYILDMDTNNSNFSRTCTITFIGNAEDGTQIKIPFQFTQQGQEEIVNEGEYDNYKGYFMDFEGAVHSVSFITNPRSDIYGDIRLAGDSPVVVSYSENGYLYDPIRTSTCTVKVVSSHYLMNLYSGKAQGTQVILRNEDTDTIEWCGFLQPNLYNQGFTECIEEIEFEASDCLSTLQYLRYEYFYNFNGQPMIVSFKNIVDTIADRCKLINSYVFTQKLYSNSDESKIFDFKEFYISENNFYSEEGEPWTYQEVLEETCKYFGYVCFQWGDRIYFMDYDKYNSDKSMVGYRYVKEDDWYNRDYITLSNYNRITEKSIRGTGADISLDDVFNKVSVNCNYYNLEHLLPDLFEDDLLTERNQMTLTTVVNRGQEIGSKTSYIVYDHKNIKSHFYKPIVGEYSHEIEVQPTEDEFNSRTFFKDFVGANIVDMYYLDYGDVSGRSYESKEWEKYLMISQLNRPWCAGYGEWETYNLPIMEFTQIPQVFIDNHKEVYESNTTTGGRVPATRVGMGTSSTTPNSRPSINTNKSEHYLVIRAEGAFTPFFAESYVPENVEQRGFKKWSNTEYGDYTFDMIKDTTNKAQNFAPKLTFYLEIPTAGWWDGSKWVDYETWFEVPLEELHYSDEIWYSWKNTQNKVETNLFLGISGYKIQLPESMESTAFMQFKIGMPKRFAHVTNNQGGDNKAEAGNAYCFIKNLEMDIVSRNTALLKNEDVVYENVIDDNNVVDGPEWDLKITSDNNITYSFSTVSTKYGEDMVNTTNFRFYDLEGELILPEEAIISRCVNQYSSPSIKENMTVDMSFTPAQMVTDTYWGDKDFVIVGQELDYARCSQKVTLLEKK